MGWVEVTTLPCKAVNQWMYWLVTMENKLPRTIHHMLIQATKYVILPTDLVPGGGMTLHISISAHHVSVGTT